MANETAALARCAVELGAQGLADDYRVMLAAHRVPIAQQCDECRTAYFPPLLACRECSSPKLSWVSCGDTGKVGTFVTVHTADATPSMAIPRRLLDQVPYTSVYAVPDALPAVRLPALMLGPQQQRIGVGRSIRFEANGGPALLAYMITDEGVAPDSQAPRDAAVAS
jgi:hypothetical protein